MTKNKRTEALESSDPHPGPDSFPWATLPWGLFLMVTKAFQQHLTRWPPLSFYFIKSVSGRPTLCALPAGIAAGSHREQSEENSLGPVFLQH